MKLLKKCLWVILFVAPIGLFAQKKTIVIEPENITMEVGEKKQLTA